MLIKILDVFANEIVKTEKRNVYVYLKEDILLIFEKSACEKGIYKWNQEITKSKQTSVYKWQCECEYPSSPESTMTLMTLSSCFQTDHSWISFELMPGNGTKERNKGSHAARSNLL